MSDPLQELRDWAQKQQKWCMDALVNADGNTRPNLAGSGAAFIEMVEEIDAMIEAAKLDARPADVIEVRRSDTSTCPLRDDETTRCWHPARVRVGLHCCNPPDGNDVDNVPSTCPLRDGDTIVRLEIVSEP